MGLEEFIAENGIYNALLIDITIAIIILLAGFAIGKIAGIIIERLLSELQVEEHVSKVARQRVSLKKGLASIASIIIYALAIILALAQLGLSGITLRILAILTGIIIIGSIILGLIHLLPNIYGTIRIKNKKLFSEGDNIGTKLVEGTVQKITLTNTHLEHNGEKIVVANSYFLNQKTVRELKRNTSK